MEHVTEWLLGFFVTGGILLVIITIYAGIALIRVGWDIWNEIPELDKMNTARNEREPLDPIVASVASVILAELGLLLLTSTLSFCHNCYYIFFG